MSRKKKRAAAAATSPPTNGLVTLTPHGVKPMEDLFYHQSERKLYKRQTFGPWHSFVQVLPMDITTPAHRWQGKRIPIDFWHQIASFFVWANQTHRSEAVVHLFYHANTDKESRGWDMLAMPQSGGNGMSVRTYPDHPDYAKTMERLKSTILLDPDDVCMVSTVHSHCNMSAFASQCDKDDEKKKEGLHITLGALDKVAYDIDARTSFRGELLRANLVDWFQLPDEAYKLLNDGMIDEDQLDAMIRRVLTRPIGVIEFPDWWKENYIIGGWYANTYSQGTSCATSTGGHTTTLPANRSYSGAPRGNYDNRTDEYSNYRGNDNHAANVKIPHNRKGWLYVKVTDEEGGIFYIWRKREWFEAAEASLKSKPATAGAIAYEAESDAQIATPLMPFHEAITELKRHYQIRLRDLINLAGDMDFDAYYFFCRLCMLYGCKKGSEAADKLMEAVVVITKDFDDTTEDGPLTNDERVDTADAITDDDDEDDIDTVTVPQPGPTPTEEEAAAKAIAEAHIPGHGYAATPDAGPPKTEAQAKSQEDGTYDGYDYTNQGGCGY